LRVTIIIFSFSCLYHNVIGASEVSRIEWAGLNCIVLLVSVLQHLHIGWPLWTDNCQTVRWRSEMMIIQLGFVIYLWTCRFNSHSANYRHHDRGELSYLAPLGSENISAPYFKQCFFGGCITPQTVKHHASQSKDRNNKYFISYIEFCINNKI
jgi:hypothetical protein